MNDRRRERRRVAKNRRKGIYVYEDEVMDLASALGVPTSNLQQFINERAEELIGTVQGGGKFS